MKSKKSIITGLFLIIGLLLGLSINRGSAVLVWGENFDDPPFDDWYLHSYDYTTGMWLLDSFPPIFSYGVVQMSPPGDIHRMASAIHNSSTAYGTWNFDFYIANDSIISAAFICNDQGGGENYSLEGLLWADINMVAYILYITSGEATHWSLTENSILLKLFTGELLWDYGVLANHQFSAPFPGYHNLEITRNSSQGEFDVNLDSEHLFTVTDNEVTTSLIFEFCTFEGSASFDNLTVYNTVDYLSTTTTTTNTQDTSLEDTKTTTSATTNVNGIEFGVLVLALANSVFFIRKRKK